MNIQEIIDIIKNNTSIRIGENLDITQYSGIVQYYPEELVIIVKSGTNNAELKNILMENNQALDFFLDETKTIGDTYCRGGDAVRGSVLGVQIIDADGNILNFGGEVMKNVAGYDVARLLCGSGGKCGIITQISFKVLPQDKAKHTQPPTLNAIDDTLRTINTKIISVFDKKGKFS